MLFPFKFRANETLLLTILHFIIFSSKSQNGSNYNSSSIYAILWYNSNRKRSSMFTKKNILTHLFFLIIAVGLKRYDVTAPDLTWNMFLALVTLDFAILTNHTKSHILKVIAGLLWLFFYPNTFTWWQTSSICTLPTQYYGNEKAWFYLCFMFQVFSLGSWLALKVYDLFSLLFLSNPTG